VTKDQISTGLEVVILYFLTTLQLSEPLRDTDKLIRCAVLGAGDVTGSTQSGMSIRINVSGADSRDQPSVVNNLIRKLISQQERSIPCQADAKGAKF
jgi:hypothetical protein